MSHATLASHDAPTASSPPRRKRWYQRLYVQVLIGVAAGILLGHYYPTLGEAMKPLGDVFLKAVKLIIAPWFSAPSCTASPA